MASFIIRKGAVCAVVLLYPLQLILSQSVCPPGSSPTWGEWGCNSSANVVMRSATCNDSNITTVTETMDGTPVITWSRWSPWLPTCGSNVTLQERRRTCTVPQEPHFCSSCGSQNTTEETTMNVTSLPPCCEEFSWASWLPWSPEPLCCSGDRVEQTRRRGRIPCEGDNCPQCPEEVDNRTALVQSWANWGVWSGFLQSCSETTYRNRSRVCGLPTNPDNLDLLQLCLPHTTYVEYGCCQTTYMWTRLDNTSKTCEQQYCLEVCSRMATPLLEGVSVTNLTVEQLVCTQCEPGTQRNVTGHEPTSKPTPFPFLSTYWWIILLIFVVAAVAVAVIIAAFVLCCKSYQKYRHTYYLKLKRETMQGVYGDVILGQKGKLPDTVEHHNLLGTYWSNPLHAGKEDSQKDMTIEDWENPFQEVEEEEGNVVASSLDEEDNLILANPVFMMKSVLPSGTQKGGTAKLGEHPLNYQIDIELETRADSGGNFSDTHSQYAEVGNQSGDKCGPCSSTLWERFDDSDDINGEEDGAAVSLLNEDLSSNTTSIDGKEGSNAEEKGGAVCQEDEEPAQGVQLEEPPDGYQELELVESHTKTVDGEVVNRGSLHTSSSPVHILI